MLKGKTAVVTGGSRGIGRAISLKLAENSADMALLYAGNREMAEETVRAVCAFGVRCVAYQCNVADFDETACVIKQITEDFGHVDILVNNAGITRDKLMMSMKETDFSDVLDVNLKGAFHTMKLICPLFLRQKSGKIINISSVAGLIGNAGQTNYSASKAGMIGLTKSAARELASRGICCNAVAPGFIATDMTKDFTGQEAVINTIPLKRIGLPEEVASLVLFLASPQSDYITGNVIRIDGGLAM